MQLSDRRLARRFPVAMPVHYTAWNSGAPERFVHSLNVSERGAYFETASPPEVGATLQLRIDMPEEVTGVPAAEWRCIAKVVRTAVVNKFTNKVGVGIRLEFYEVVGGARAKLKRKPIPFAADPRSGAIGIC
jgi:PilZ domain